MNTKQAVKLLLEKAERQMDMGMIRGKEHEESPDDARPLLAHETHFISAATLRGAAKLLCEHPDTTPLTGIGDVCDLCGEIILEA